MESEAKKAAQAVAAALKRLSGTAASRGVGRCGLSNVSLR